MKEDKIIGRSVPKKESLDKVSGIAEYTNDKITPDLLYAKMLTSPYAHAKINKITLAKAKKVVGVRAILTGESFPLLTGEEIRDRPLLAIDKVRYHGEPVAIVIADQEYQAKKAVQLIEVDYTPLSVINSPSEALQEQATLVHENLQDYEHIDGVFPEPNTNIANTTKIRKGNMDEGWNQSEIVVEESFSFTQSDHAAMETRSSMVEIKRTGHIEITTSTQSPFLIKKLFMDYFNIPSGFIIVHTPFVGGGFGGKVPVQLELLAYIASMAVNGRKVKLTNTREEDMITSPVHIGLEAWVKLGCSRDGMIKATEITFLFDGGAYSDKAIDVSRAAASDCTGPYNIENVWCDSLCVYTNHPYATAYRSFGHTELAFAVERTMDELAKRLKMDPLELRYKNALVPGNTTPTQALLTSSNIGNLPECIRRLKKILHWNHEPQYILEGNKIRTKGVSCFLKTSNIDTNAGSGAILTFNSDGSANLSSGVVEIGTGTKTVLAQIVAERLNMNVDKIHVNMEVNTKNTPEHWKTVASRGTFMAGRAVWAAAEDAKKQLFEIASDVLRTSPEDLEIGKGKVFLKDNPLINVDIKDIAHGYLYPNGNTVGQEVIGRGSYTLRHLTFMDPETGKGTPGPEWTVGAQAVETELDLETFTYKILKAVTVIDSGKVLNYKGAKGQVMGAMSMGLGFASREQFAFNKDGIILNPRLRTYTLIRYGENPKYIVDFVETPHLESPYGARGLGEHGLIGMPSALANSLSLAIQAPLNQLPLTPELLWRTKEGLL